jgi:dipeptidyl aminopeptidase/acylaminoacyl peptidase
MAIIGVSAQEPPEKLTSPDGKYSVQILDKPMPGADSLEEFTLVLSANGKEVAKVPTFGYLTAAHWSDDGKYVAVNNRRGNSGDYIWVFDLSTGKALKRPDDKNGEAWEKAAAKAVHKQLPSANENTLNRDWVTATGWKDGQLQFVVRSVYRGDEHKWDFEAAADPGTGQIKSSKLVKKSADD